ncbi:anti-phage dCTP deaminase [Magnetospirillum sp. 15-1]|uniref:anti-phage dCTP deaminase n=1 Tax=Magnetospirillum sp. 15-1 TaxID=1979370 RepID=UPI0011446D52|nr:anti-phage dCTP deaminase [Magnetospirillum sp. 15-1]
MNKPDLFAEPAQQSVATSISERLSQEIVIALVGPVGSGVSTAAEFIKSILCNDFDYKVCEIIKPSAIILREAHRVGITEIPKTPHDQYITAMQTAGNSLREKFGGNYLAEKIVELIYKFRRDNGGYSDGGVPLPGRRAYIIDSVKNPEELSLLRKIYGETLCLFGVFAPDHIRKQRLKDAGVPDDAIKKIIDRDQNELATFGQKTRKIFTESDFFICNDKKRDELRVRVLRFVNIVFNTAIHTPTRAESAMYEAGAAAANSACMSRQVGAAIVSQSGELVSVGWNDVPRFGGGLYGEDHQSTWDAESNCIADADNRCFKWGGNICHNETRRNQIVNKICDKVGASGLLKKGKTGADVSGLLRGATDIDALIEFSRSIHAEMEAILSVAREGRHSLVGATLYTNTYPCHNCARHIVASGITSVVYIEPYQKSLAIALHNDAITEDPESKTKVVFRQYDGVAPRHYLRLFRPTGDRKKDGRLIQQSPKAAVPIFRVPLDAPTEYEVKVIADLADKEQTPL